MFIQLEFITGVNLGFEIIEEEDATYFLIDLLILRVLIEKFKKSK